MRGVFPYSLGYREDEGLLEIPGVTRLRSGEYRATRDAFQVVTGRELPERKIEDPDLEGYAAKGYRDRLRSYQKEDAVWLASNHYAIHRGAMRSGKTRTATAAATLVRAKRILIIGPALARRGWLNEIKSCEGEDLLTLHGRGATRGRYRGEPIKGDALAEALKTCRWVFVNYEILGAHHERDDAGKMHIRKDLPGWGASLLNLNWDLGIIDESQYLRGISQGFKIEKLSRREIVRKIFRNAPRVWALTGTPMMGRPRDLWGQLDVITGGCWGHKHFTFDARYCGGGHYGFRGAWVIGEPTNQDELNRRLADFVRARSRKEILPFLPDKTREIVWIEPDGPIKQIARGSSESKATRALRATLAMKIPKAIEKIHGELLEGAKVLVLTDRKESCEEVHRAFEKLRKDSALPNFQLWLGDGRVTVEARVTMAEKFRAHRGCGVFCSNIAALSGGISLYSSEAEFPSTSVHFLEWGYTPEAMAQAEDRMNDPDNRSRGLAIYHWGVEGTIDEHIAALLLPKVEAISVVLESDSSRSMAVALATPKEILDRAWESYAKTLGDAPEIWEDDE